MLLLFFVVQKFVAVHLKHSFQKSFCLCCDFLGEYLNYISIFLIFNVIPVNFIQIAINAQEKNCANVKNKIFPKFLSPNPINTYKFHSKKFCKKFVKSAQVFPIYGGTYI